MASLPPAGPPGTAGPSFLRPVDVWVVIDYQNIHLTARDLFVGPRTPAQKSQVHPLKFAERIVTLRSARRKQREKRPIQLRRVLVFRGQPRFDREPRLYDITDAQRTEWTRDSRVNLTYRSLKSPPLWPAEPAREKGIDVEVALNLLTTAEDVRSPIVILATHDTDLEPALAIANRRKGSGVRVETAGWAGGRRLGRHLKLWHTTLNADEFELARDRRNYSVRRKPARTKR